MLLSQEVVSTGGDYYKNESGSISSTLGETVVETFSQNSYILTQGFQQSSLEVTAIEEISRLYFEINAFPNPTTEFVKLKVDTKDFAGMKFKLIDMNGRTLQIKNITQNETNIYFHQLPPATYLLIVNDRTNELKTFKIIKR